MPDRFPTLRRMLRDPNLFGTWWPRRATPIQRQAVLRLIAAATEERTALSPLLEAWAVDERGAQRGRVRRLAELVNNGVGLADAVEQVPGVLGDEDVLAIRFGAQSGVLAAAVRERLRDEFRSSAGRGSRVRRAIAYLTVIGIITAIVATFICVKILPSYRAILRDYSLTGTRPLQWLIEIAIAISQYWWVGAIAGLVALALAFSATSGRFLRHSVVGRMVRPLRESYAAEVLRLLGVAANAGRPLTGAVSTLARYHFDPVIRHKLLYVRNEMEQDADMWQSMSGAGLIAPQEATFLATAERVGNRPWALNALSAAMLRRTNRRIEQLSALALPAVVMVIGSFVLLQALAIFTPLIKLAYFLT